MKHTLWVHHADGIAWEESRQLHENGLCHGVTGRTGGVSREPFASLNMALHTGDSIRDVLENRRRLCTHLGCGLENLTTPQQTHGDHIVAVGETERGRGAGSYADALPHTDALMTNVPGILLMICIADCVPVILYDPVQQACAVVHDGWRGTVKKLAAKTVFAMNMVYGCRPQDIRAYIGPSISSSHFEVSKATADEFRQMGSGYETCIQQKNGILQVDLWQANWKLLAEAGLEAAHIDQTEQCAYDQYERFYSYRRDQGHTGRMAAFAMLGPAR